MNKVAVNTIYFVRFLNTLANFVLTFWMALLLLEAPFNFSKTQIVFLVFWFALGNQGFEVVCALFVHRFKYKTLLLTGLMITTLANFALILFPHFVAAFSIILIYGFFFSIVSLSSRLWLLRSTDPKERVMSFGRLYWAINVASGIATLLVFFIPYRGFVDIIFYGLSFLLIVALISLAVFFRDDSAPPVQPHIMQLPKVFIANFSTCKKTIPYYAMLLVLLYLVFQMSLFPYYTNQFGITYKYMGFALAINPLMVILMQKHMSQWFYTMFQKFEDLGFIVGFVFIVMAFFSLSLGFEVFHIVFYIVLFTVGEMLVFPNVDFVVTRHIPLELRSIFVSMTGLLIALGKTFGESGGISIINWMTEYHLRPNTIWVIDFLVAVVALVGLVAMSIYRFLPRKRSAMNMTQA